MHRSESLNLKTLNLHGLDQLKTLPESLGNLSGNLKHLNISHCGKFEMFMQRVPRFFTLPASSGSLVGLKSLQILKCSAMKELPTSIARLVGLEKLVILECGLKEMPSIETLTALRWLQLEVSGGRIQDAFSLTAVPAAASNPRSQDARRVQGGGSAQHGSRTQGMAPTLAPELRTSAKRLEGG